MRATKLRISVLLLPTLLSLSFVAGWSKVARLEAARSSAARSKVTRVASLKVN